MSPINPAILQKYPAIEDLKKRAKKRLPLIAWEYLDMGTGDETSVSQNEAQFKHITFKPQFFKGKQTQDLTTTLFGRTYKVPFGVSPVGFTGIMWPNAEQILAKTAKANQFPYSLSTLASQTPETIGPLAGDMGWFQLYPPHQAELRNDILDRAKQSGFGPLLVTADVPAPSRRERTARAGLRIPPRITPFFVWQALQNPHWTMAVLKNGLPRLRTIEKYAGSGALQDVMQFVRNYVGGTLDWEYLKQVKAYWDGPVIPKGLLHPEDVEKALDIGVDAIFVSNHGGRQFDGAPAAIDVLPEIAKVVNGRCPIIFDSGVRSGLDIIRALALGADFVMMGRPFMFGVAAFGEQGGQIATEILIADLKANMAQLGVTTIDEIKALEPITM
ncbi:MAG: alpha-hydroxy acid oxidase [Chloroflexota bacterium]